MSNPKRRRITLAASLTLFVFLLLLAVIVFGGIIAYLLIRFNMIVDLNANKFHYLIGVMFLSSVLVGAMLTPIFSKRPLKPFHHLISATEQIASGNFDVRVEMKGPEEFQKLSNSFNKMARELKSIETLRDDFVSNVSHEFKTPIVSIRGFAKLLKKDNLTKEARDEYLDIIIKESDRLSQLAGNILFLSKLENQEILSEKESFILDEQLRRTILVMAPEFKKKNISIEIELEPVEYVGNEELLQQVWLNVIGNAIKFTPNGGEIGVAMKKKENMVFVEIRDSGEGIDKETMDHLFDKFYQGDKSHATEGNGLGLSLVKRILDLSDGEIYVASSLGKGSTFTVKLPMSN